MEVKQNAARLLDAQRIAYEVREYEVDADDLMAESVARKIGPTAEQVFKTLVARSDKNGCALVVRGWWFVVGGSWLVVRGWWLVVGDCVLVVTKLHRQLRTTNYELRTTYHQPPTTNHRE